MTKVEEQAYIHDTFDTMAQIIADRFCIQKDAIKEWLSKKGYTTKDFGKIINETKKDTWLSDVIWS